MEALSTHLAKRLTRLSGLIPLGTFAAMWGSCVLLLPTMPLMSAARVIKCLATGPDGWPGLGCLNRLFSVDRFLGSRCQSRLSAVWCPRIFKEVQSTRAPQWRPIEFFITI